MNVLIGDLGGTKTILAVVSAETGPRRLLQSRTYVSAQYRTFEEMIAVFLEDTKIEIQRACLAVAGPITNGRANITNLSWTFDAATLCKRFNLSEVQLINDLEAVACAVPVLQPSEIFVLNEGVPVKDGSIAVIAPGTGLGEAYLTHDGSSYHAHASEGAHVSFGPTNDLQMKLLAYMREKKGFEHVSYERVCSGALGFPNLYDFLNDTDIAHEPEWLAGKLKSCEDPTPIIIESARDKDNPSPISRAALDLFCDILAAEAGNHALKVLATGGVYFGGGMPPRILDELSKPGFLEIMANKGRFKELISKMPVKVILNPQAGLIGAGVYGLEHHSGSQTG